MNNCGCNNIRGPLLTENKVKSLLSENLQYHLDKDIPLFESVFRIGSNAHLKLIKEARKMYSRNIIDLCEEDEHLIKTHLGEFALYKGEAIPLDLPMLNESYDYDEIAQSEFGMDYDQLGPGEKEWVRDEIDNMLNEFALPKFDVVKPIIDQFLGGVEKAGKKLLEVVKREGKQTLVLVKEIAEYVIKGEKPNTAEEKKINKQLLDLGFLALLGITGNIPVSIVGILYWILQESGVAKEFLKLDEKLTIAGKEVEKIDKKGNDPENWVVKYKDGSEEPYLKTLNEAKKKKKKKDPPLGKPKRGGPKAYYVYVRDPKTKRIKKVTFGSGGLRAKIRNKKARNAFAKRHDCKNKKDRTKASYWSCNLPRYASMLGLGANMNTFW